MWWQWLIFGIIFVSIPIGLKCLLETEKSKIINNTQKKYNKIVFTKLCCYYWLADLFYMSFIIKSIVCKFIFGGLVVLIVLYNLSMAFLKQTVKNGNKLLKLGLLQDFVVGIGMSIWLIYLIPDSDLQTIAMTMVAAVYGGLFTLVGVAWTIKKGDNDRKEEERKKYIPYVSFQSNSLPLDRRLDAFCVKIPRSKQDKKLYYHFDPFEIKNISSSNIIFKGIRFNNDIDIFCKKFILEKEKSLDVRIEGGLNIGIDLSAIGLLAEDMLCNTYYLKCDFQCCPFSNKWDDAESKNDNFDLDTLSCKITGIDLPVMLEGEKHE